MTRWQLLVPVKGTTHAKSRFGDAFGPHRPRLALAFGRDTVAAALKCPAVAGVTVTTADAAAAAAFDGAGANVFEDFASAGLNTAIAYAVRQIAALRGGPVAVLLGDLPALASDALERALALAEPHQAAFTPDAQGTGTTLLCARSASLLQPRFGPASAAAHESAGAVRLRGSRLDTLRQDVDDVDDLLAAVRLGVGEHTREALREAGWNAPELAASAPAEGRTSCM